MSYYFSEIFNYYHLSLLLTSLNCVADPALYCFVSESARRGLHKAIFRPVARILCCCCRRGNASPAHPASDSHEVATDENNGHPTVTLLTHTSTHKTAHLKRDTDTNASKDTSTILITHTNKEPLTPLIKPTDTHSNKDTNSAAKSNCLIALVEQDQKTEI